MSGNLYIAADSNPKADQSDALHEQSDRSSLFTTSQTSVHNSLSNSVLANRHNRLNLRTIRPAVIQTARSKLYRTADNAQAPVDKRCMRLLSSRNTIIFVSKPSLVIAISCYSGGRTSASVTAQCTVMPVRIRKVLTSSAKLWPHKQIGYFSPP